MTTFYVYAANYRMIGEVEAVSLAVAIELAEAVFPGHAWVDARLLRRAA